MGKYRIEHNIGDAAGASASELSKGVEDVMGALALGHPETKEAYRLLAAAYNSLAFMAGDGSQERRALRAKEGEAYRRVAELDPNDGEALFSYAMTVEGEAARLAALEDVIRRHPEHGPARMVAGGLRIALGAPDQGVADLKEAARLFTVNEAVDYGHQIVGTLDSMGRSDDANEVERVLASKRSRRQGNRTVR